MLVSGYTFGSDRPHQALPTSAFPFLSALVAVTALSLIFWNYFSSYIFYCSNVIILLHFTFMNITVLLTYLIFPEGITILVSVAHH